MKIFLGDIPEADSLDVDVTEREDALNRAFRDGLEDLLRFASPVTGAFHVTRREGTIFLGLVFKGALTANCSRCLGEFEYLLNETSQLTFFPRSDEEGDEGETDEISGRDYYDGQSVDLGEILKEEIALRLPDAPLCFDGCKGLCQQCGQNLNEGNCSCGGGIDDKFAILKNLKLD